MPRTRPVSPLSRFSRPSRLAGAAALPVLLAAAPHAVLAHVGADGAAHLHDRIHADPLAQFVAGIVHPLTGADHLAAMLAVGLWSALAARRGGAELLRAPLAFAAMLLAGALLGLRGVALPAVEPMIAASLLVLGLLVATRLRLPAAAGALAAGGFAVFHGVAHGTEMAGDDRAAWMLAGMLAATLGLHAAGIAAGWALRRQSAWLPRIAGALVAGLGVALLARMA